MVSSDTRHFEIIAHNKSKVSLAAETNIFQIYFWAEVISHHRLEVPADTTCYENTFTNTPKFVPRRWG